MSSNYSVFTYATDPARGLHVPVGVALWSSDSQQVSVRLMHGDERLHGVRTADLLFIGHMESKVRSWIKERALPYMPESLKPWDNRWWSHATKIIKHRTRLSAPMAVESTFDVETLYESIVAPYRPRHENKKRIDGEIAKCLKTLTKDMPARAQVPGVGGRSVTVTRAYDGARATVVVEGINLAASPDANADLALGKLMRIRDGSGRRCEIAIGYLTSPSGLNGEKVLIEHICERVGAKAFDVVRDRTVFSEEVHRLVAEADGQNVM